jgi:hypothetical protein
LKISTLNWHHLIETLMPFHSESVVDEVIGLWESMATQIIMIVGDGGFNSLYVRALSLTQPTFPWLTATSPPSQATNRFAELATCLEGQSPEQARAANNQLLTTFTDILATLIGEDLTIQILRSAWGIEASDGSWRKKENE